MNASNMKMLLCGVLGFFMAWALFAPVQEDEHDHEHGHDNEHAHHHHDHDGHDEEVAIADEDLEKNGIHVVRVKSAPISETVEGRGKVIFHPDRMAHVLPKIAGVVHATYKKIGDRVVAGETLATLESKEMAEQKADYLSHLSQEALDKENYDRENNLFEKGISSQAALSQAKMQWEKARIDAELSKQKLLSYGLTEEELKALDTQTGDQLRIYRIKAPLSGVVIERHLTQGEYVESTDEIFALADLSTVWVELGLPAQYGKGLKEGQKVDLSFSCSEEGSVGKIVHVPTYFEEGSISFKVLAEVPNSRGLLCPGAFAAGSIHVGHLKEALLIPQEAVQEMEGETKVFIKHTGHFVPVTVELGIKGNGVVEVLSGLSSDDEIAADGSFLLKADLGKEELEHEH
ncbi:MAG: efflux RND transporter periplasmic adaptor subunit [Parachlamydiaceae bacterium]